MALPPRLTPRLPVKFVPVITISSPMHPPPGEMPVIVGACPQVMLADNKKTGKKVLSGKSNSSSLFLRPKIFKIQ